MRHWSAAARMSGWPVSNPAGSRGDSSLMFHVCCVGTSNCYWLITRSESATGCACVLSTIVWSRNIKTKRHRPPFGAESPQKKIYKKLNMFNYSSWFQTFAMLSILCVFFRAIPWLLNFICRRFETLCVPSSWADRYEELPRRKHTTVLTFWRRNYFLHFSTTCI
jgi:hypothetical protein